MAISHLRNMIENVASFASKYLEKGPHFPVDLSPGDSVSLSDKRDKFFEVPRSIDYMLGSNLSVIIYI